MQTLHSASQHRRLASLKQLTHDALIFFRKAPAKLWNILGAGKEELGYERTDRLRKLPDRDKLKTQQALDDVTDFLVAARQQGRITEQKASRLSAMLGKVEARKHK